MHMSSSQQHKNIMVIDTHGAIRHKDLDEEADNVCHMHIGRAHDQKHNDATRPSPHTYQLHN